MINDSMLLQSFRTHTSWNVKVDDADSYLPYHQPISRTSMNWSWLIWTITSHSPLQLRTYSIFLKQELAVSPFAWQKKNQKNKQKKLSFWLHLKLCSDIWFDTSAQKSWAFCCIKGEVGRKRDGLGVWLMQTVTFRMDREQDPNGQQRGIYSISHDKQYGKSI